MRHTFLVLTVKKWLKSVYIYGSYRKIKTGVPLFLDHSVYLSTYLSMLTCLSIGIVLAVQVLLRYLMDSSLGICLEETKSHRRRLPVGSFQFFLTMIHRSLWLIFRKQNAYVQ